MTGGHNTLSQMLHLTSDTPSQIEPDGGFENDPLSDYIAELVLEVTILKSGLADMRDHCFELHEENSQLKRALWTCGICSALLAGLIFWGVKPL